MRLARRLAVLTLVLPLAGCTAARWNASRLPAGLGAAAMPPPRVDLGHRTPVDAERVQLTRDYLAIHNPRVAAALPPGDDAAAIAFVPRLVVVHFTAQPTLAETLATFAPVTIDAGRELVASQGGLNVGIQYVVDRDGTIYGLYPETAIARHVIGLNHVAIGIENVGAADLGGPADQAPLTPAQLAANVALITDLARRHPTIEFVIGHHEYRDVERPGHPAAALFHEEVAGYRTEKVDPGPRFMRRLRRALRAAADGALSR